MCNDCHLQSERRSRLCIVGNYGKLENRNLIYSAFLSPITLHN